MLSQAIFPRAPNRLGSVLSGPALELSLTLLALLAKLFSSWEHPRVPGAHCHESKVTIWTGEHCKKHRERKGERARAMDQGLAIHKLQAQDDRGGDLTINKELRMFAAQLGK